MIVLYWIGVNRRLFFICTVMDRPMIHKVFAPPARTSDTLVHEKYHVYNIRLFFSFKHIILSTLCEEKILECIKEWWAALHRRLSASTWGGKLSAACSSVMGCCGLLWSYNWRRKSKQNLIMSNPITDRSHVVLYRSNAITTWSIHITHWSQLWISPP